MNVLTFDFETSCSNKGNPFDQTNGAVCLGIKWIGLGTHISYFDTISWKQDIQNAVNKADILVAFNAKFDLHWLRKLGISFEGKRVWCCQLAEFILNNQKTPYPSLDQAAEKYGLEKKLDVVKLNYWDKGIDTKDIPREVLSSYCAHDVELTEQVFKIQYKQFTGEEL